jgi:hypothetical protein
VIGQPPGTNDEKTTVDFWIVVVLAAIAGTALFAGALWLIDLEPINP